MNNLGEKIMKLRKESALSQEELGEKLNVTRQTVSKWELGETTPEINKLTEMAKIFNVSLDELLKEEGVEMNNNKGPIEDGKKEFSRNTIIVVILIIVLVGVIGGVTYEVIKKANENKAADKVLNIFDKVTKQGEEITQKVIEQQNKAIDQMPSADELNNRRDDMKKEFDKEVERQNADFNKSSYNSKYENLYTGLKDKFFTEAAIKYVIEDNLNNDRKITVKYNGTEAVETKELTDLISKLNKNKYILSYEHDGEGYINVMNIEDV